MQRIILIITILLISANWCEGKHLYKEAEYQAYWCNKHGGVMEYRLKTGERVDCVLPEYAVEVDFAKKWNECVGQALSYASVLNKNPKCVLILEDKTKEMKYKKRLERRIIQYYSSKYPNFNFSVNAITKEGLEQYYRRKHPELIKLSP